MQTIPQAGMNLYSNQIEVSQEVASAMFHSVEKAEKLILGAARQQFDEQIKFAQSLAAVRDPQGVATLQKAFFGHSPERAMDYQKQVLQIVMETNSAIGHALESYMRGVKEGANGLTQAGHGAAASSGNGNPASAGNAFFPMWEAAFKEFAKNANQLMPSVNQKESVKGTKTASANNKR
jgi:phasin family protein